VVAVAGCEVEAPAPPKRPAPAPVVPDDVLGVLPKRPPAAPAEVVVGAAPPNRLAPPADEVVAAAGWLADDVCCCCAPNNPPPNDGADEVAVVAGGFEDELAADSEVFCPRPAKRLDAGAAGVVEVLLLSGFLPILPKRFDALLCCWLAEGVAALGLKSDGAAD